MNQLDKFTANGKAVGACPNCPPQAEGLMFVINAMQWTKENKWQRLTACDVCGYEQQLKEGN